MCSVEHIPHVCFSQVQIELYGTFTPIAIDGIVGKVNISALSLQTVLY